MSACDPPPEPSEILRPLALSVGDPAGIGPQVAIDAVLEARPEGGCVLFGDPDALAEALDARRAGSLVVRLGNDGPFLLPRDGIGLAPGPACSRDAIRLRAPSPEGGRVQLAWLDAAVVAVRRQFCRALVTGPTSKEAIVAAGVPFMGQTEHLARSTGLADDAVTMMFLGARLRVALVTTHLAVEDVPSAITEPRVERTILHLAEALLLLRTSMEPCRLVVAGLNPHAGEGGLFGRQEIEVVAPVVARLRPSLKARGIELSGPRPAESVFREAAAGQIDGVVAMMHDQATIASKLLDWGQAVNVTWGLPFVRTSVDHGVAYDAAKSGGGHAEGMLAALRMAERLTRP